MTWTITAIVNDAWNGGTENPVELLIRFDNENQDIDHYSNIGFDTREYTGTTYDPYISVTYTALVAPTVTTSAATSVEATTARLNGNVTNTGGDNPTVTVYWGDNDGGTTPGNWDNNSVPTSPSQPQGVAAFYKDVTGLPTATTIYFSASANNSAGTSWGTTKSFLTKPASPTNVSATENSATKVTVTWTKSTGATNYRVYRGTTNDSGTLGDVATYDDTAAGAPLITAGSSVASDGTSATQVNLSLSGTSVADGSTESYTVYAYNTTGWSAASSGDNGHRVATALTYQWNRSAADSDANYSTIGGATASTYADTGGVYDPDGRYYTCTLVSTGASNTPATSTANRGYMAAAPLIEETTGGNDTTDQQNHTVNVFATPPAGQLLLVLFASDGNPTITFPAEWTQLFQDANGSDVIFGAWYRVADGTETATITVTTSSSQMTAHTSFRISNYGVLPVVGTSATGASVNPNPPTLTPWWGSAYNLWFAVSGSDYNRTVSAYPSGYSNGRYDRSNNTGGCTVGSASKIASASSDNPGTFTISSSDQWVANTIAIAPPTITAAAPTVTTQAGTNVEATTATGNGNITSINGAYPTKRGICYSSVNNPPTTADSKEEENGSFGTGAYTESLVSLSTGTTYYLRAYAINTGGTGYGTTVTILTKPAAPTNVSATDGTYSNKVTITWTKSTGATGYRVYEGSNNIGGLLGDVATYDDSAAAAGTVSNAGTVTASDGSSSLHVTLSLAGEATTNGASRTYKVVAVNATGNSADSATDTGYRGVGAFSYQWQRSAGDSDASYSDISGATTDPYNDTGGAAPTITGGTVTASDGTSGAHITLSVAGEAGNNAAGRYYKCLVSAVDASNNPQTSDNNRGYRGTTTLTYQWQRSAADSDASYSPLGGATTDPYDDTTAPVDGSGRWYYCVVSMAGASDQDTSNHDRGYWLAVPIVTTQDALVTGDTTATGNGNITYLDPSPSDERGFDWDVDSGAPYANSQTDVVGGYTVGAFQKGLTGMPANTLIYYRAKAHNAEGWGYGNEMTFTTFGPPVVTTQTASDVGSTIATLNGNITSLNGDVSCTERGFVYDTVTHGNPGDVNPAGSGYSDALTDTGIYSTGAFGRNATGLLEMTDYFVRAYAMNIYGYSYGDEITFTTGGVALWFQPNDYISADVMPDRAGGHDGVITWGDNPADFTVTLGSMVSTGEPGDLGIGSTPSDVLPTVGVSDWFVEPDISGSLASNPLRPLVRILVDTTDMPEIWAWRLLALIFILFVTVTAGVAVKGHMLIAGIVAGASIGAMIALTIYPLWCLVFIIMAIAAGVISERSQSL